MRSALIFRLAARDLFRQRRRTAMALFILVVGVCAVLFTRAWQNGMLDLIAREGAGTWLSAVQVHPPDTLARQNAMSLEPNVRVDEALVARLQEIPGVTAVSPRIRFFGRLFKGDESGPFIGIAVDAKTAPAVVPRLLEEERLESGRLPDPARDDEILVAAPLADSLGIRAGDTATILARPLDGGLEGIDVKVAGIVRAAFEENQKRAVIVDLRLAGRLLRMEDIATQVLLQVEPLSEARRVAREIPAAVKDLAVVEAHAWDEINPRYTSARVIWATSLGVMLVVVLLVASLGLSTTIVLIVNARVKETGTLAALGLRRRSILAMFLVEGMLLGAAGGALGALAALGIVALTSKDGVPFTPPGGFLVHVRPALSLSDVGFAVLLVTLLAGLVALPTAWRAAKRPPSESMR